MKANRYTYFVELTSDKTVIFNGMTKDFLLLSSSVVPSYQEIIARPDEYKDSHPSIIKELQLAKIIVDDNYDERDILHRKRKAYIESKVAKNSIIPTFDCNFNCWYCLQKHEPIDISSQKQLLIINHIKNYIIKNDIKEYILSWFGGEPLMQPKTIEIMSHEIRTFCDAQNIKFDGAITTNGALLDNDIINMLEREHIDTYQITLDGKSQTHNKIKNSKDCDSAFNKTLGNIRNLLKINHRASVNLRFNYTPATIKELEIVDEVSKIIPHELRRKIEVDLHNVWQIREDMVKIEELKEMLEAFASAGFKLCTDHIFSICYVDKEHYNTIYYNGKVEKCDLRGMDKLRGSINDDGDIVWSERPIFGDYDLFADDCICGDCDYYPVCYNGCPVAREERIKEHGKVVCGYGNDNSLFHYRIKDYCWRTILNKAYNLR